MNLVYALEPTPEKIRQSIFLAGPSSNNGAISSWRKEMVEILHENGYNGTVFVPELRESNPSQDLCCQAEWEQTHLDLCDAILAWAPREFEYLSGLSTNVELGRYASFRKLFYGRPLDSQKTLYLDWIYESKCGLTPACSKEELATTIVEALQNRASERENWRAFCPDPDLGDRDVSKLVSRSSE